MSALIQDPSFIGVVVGATDDGRYRVSIAGRPEVLMGTHGSQHIVGDEVIGWDDGRQQAILAESPYGTGAASGLGGQVGDGAQAAAATRSVVGLHGRHDSIARFLRDLAREVVEPTFWEGDVVAVDSSGLVTVQAAGRVDSVTGAPAPFFARSVHALGLSVGDHVHGMNVHRNQQLGVVISASGRGKQAVVSSVTGWQNFGCDSGRGRYAAAADAPQKGMNKQDWVIATHDSLHAILVDAQGILLLHLGFSPYYVQAYSAPAGQLLWDSRDHGVTISSMAAVRDGVLYTCTGETLYAITITPNGATLKWSADVRWSGNPVVEMILVTEQNMVVLSHDGWVFSGWATAGDNRGTKRWETRVATPGTVGSATTAPLPLMRKLASATHMLMVYTVRDTDRDETFTTYGQGVQNGHRAMTWTIPSWVLRVAAINVVSGAVATDIEAANMEVARSFLSAWACRADQQRVRLAYEQQVYHPETRQWNYDPTQAISFNAPWTRQLEYRTAFLTATESGGSGSALFSSDTTLHRFYKDVGGPGPSDEQTIDMDSTTVGCSSLGQPGERNRWRMLAYGIDTRDEVPAGLTGTYSTIDTVPDGPGFNTQPVAHEKTLPGFPAQLIFAGTTLNFSAGGANRYIFDAATWARFRDDKQGFVVSAIVIRSHFTNNTRNYSEVAIFSGTNFAQLRPWRRLLYNFRTDSEIVVSAGYAYYWDESGNIRRID